MLNSIDESFNSPTETFKDVDDYSNRAWPEILYHYKVLVLSTHKSRIISVSTAIQNMKGANMSLIQHSFSQITY